MQVTPDMPREENSTVEASGALIDLADFIDDDGTGIKATVTQDRVRIKVDSFDPFGSTIHLTGRDAFELAQTLIRLSAELADDTAAYEGTRCGKHEPGTCNGYGTECSPRHTPEDIMAHRRAAYEGTHRRG